MQLTNLFWVDRRCFYSFLFFPFSFSFLLAPPPLMSFSPFGSQARTGRENQTYDDHYARQVSPFSLLIIIDTPKYQK
jgi:hypothetical protein